MCIQQREIPAIRWLRQQFWRQYLKQYDTDDTGTLSHIELTSMLDSLGSTLSETVNSFFTHNGKKPVEDELTVDEAIQCLEMQVGQPTNEKKRVVPAEEGGSLLDLSTPGTPGGSGMGMSRFLLTQAPPQLGKLDFSGPPMHLLEDLEVSPDDGALKVPPPPPQSTLERVINVKNCPICHRPRLNKKAEMDIITHVAMCASGDWAKIDKIVAGNFVTAIQAQRKWYTKDISKVSSREL
jgi:phosphatidylserine decarboxylase